MDDLYDVLPASSVDRFVLVLKPDSGIVPDQNALVDPLLAACRYVAKAAKITLILKTYQHEGEVVYRLNQLANDSGCRIRQVGLVGKWWAVDHGPLLVFRKSDQKPYALIPFKTGQYRLVDPVVGKKGVRLTEKVAKELECYGFFFYRPLPDTKINWKILLKFAFENLGRDVWRMFTLEVIISCLGLLIPIATGIIFDHVIPSANRDLLLQFTIGLIVITFAGLAFHVAQSIAMMRIKYKLDGILQPAVWDRLLRLPAGFFRYFSAGNLADRAGGIDQIQQALTGAVISALLGGLFSIITLFLMFYYDYILALYAMGLAFSIALINIGVDLIQLKYQRHIFQLQGIISGLLLQLFLSIGKLRIANRESQAFQLWSLHFSKKTYWYRRAGYLQIILQVFSAVVSVVSLAVLFLIVVKRGNLISFGSFVAFNAAFAQFFAAIFAMTAALSSILGIIPLYERAKPILNELPESNRMDIPIKPLGNIRMTNIAFRYPLVKTLEYSNEINKDNTNFGPWIFKNLNIEIKAGEFVALVGPSGAGKSTLFRLLLSFERAEKGLITYDDYDIATLNLHYLRRQIGVVIQNSMLFPGTIIDNLRSTAPTLTLDQAKELLACVQFDKDLEEMPMGLFTLLAEGGANLSVGQRQRLLIAQAVAHRPQILFLDEATSALDNQTQSHVYQFIKSLNMTRIVAAHRLSTILHADKIYVLDQGQIQQVGTYDQLMLESDGLFYKLVKRQHL